MGRVRSNPNPKPISPIHGTVILTSRHEQHQCKSREIALERFHVVTPHYTPYGVVDARLSSACTPGSHTSSGSCVSLASASSGVVVTGHTSASGLRVPAQELTFFDVSSWSVRCAPRREKPLTRSFSEGGGGAATVQTIFESTSCTSTV